MPVCLAVGAQWKEREDESLPPPLCLALHSGWAAWGRVAAVPRDEQRNWRHR